MSKKIVKIIITLLSVVCLLSFGFACSNISDYNEDELYDYNTDLPFYSQPDAFMTLDGKFDEPQWQGKTWLQTKNMYAGSRYKVTTTFTLEGLYVGMIGYYDNIVWDSRYNFPANTNFYIQIAKEDEISWGSYPIYNHPMRDVKFFIDAKNSLSLRETQYACGSYVDGEINSRNTNYISAELFVSWEDMNYTAEELGVDGMPNAVKIWSKFSLPTNGAWFGFSDEKKIERYFTFTKDGAIVDDSSIYLGNAINGECASEGWVVDDQNKTAIATKTGYTSTIWFKQDDLGNQFEDASDYIAQVTVSGVDGKVGKHAGLISVKNQENFNFYTANIEGLAKGEVSVRSGSEMDGGGWTASYGIQKTLNKSGTYSGDSLTLKVIKKGAYVYYFCNDEFVDYEFVAKVEGQNIVGLFATGEAVFTNWSFVNYSDNQTALDEILSQNFYFASVKKSTGGSISVDKVALLKGNGLNLTVETQTGYVLVDLLANETSIYDDYVQNAVDLTYAYTPTGDVAFTGVFKKLPNANLQQFAITVADDETNTSIKTATAKLKNSNDLLCTNIATNDSGVLVFSVLVSGTYDVSGISVTTDGSYELEISAEGYVPTTYQFVVNEKTERITDKILMANVWGAVTLNGSKTSTAGEINLFDTANNRYGLDYQGTVKQYLIDTVTDQNYVAKVDVKMQSKVGSGNVVGVMIGAGGTSSIILKGCAWELNHLCLEVYSPNGGSIEVSVSGFAHDLAGVGQSLIFTVVRFGDSIYVLDRSGDIGIVLDKDGLHLYGGRIVKQPSNIPTLNDYVKAFFNRGNENAIGLVQYVNGSGVYWYDIDFTKGDEYAQQILGDYSVEVESSSNYVASITGDIPVGENFVKNSLVHVTIDATASGKTAQLLMVAYENGTTETIVGYLTDQNVTEFSFNVLDNCTVSVVYHTVGDMASSLKVNGSNPTESGKLIYNVATSLYGVEDTSEVKRYFSNTITDGNFKVDFNAIVDYREAGKHGYYMGAIISKGASSRIMLWTTRDSQDHLILSMKNSVYSVQDVIISGFKWNNTTGGNIAFSFTYFNDVLYVYNSDGVLGFTLSNQDGLKSNFSYTTQAKDEDIKIVYTAIVNDGEQSIVGVYSKQYPNAARGRYYFDIDFTTNVSETDVQGFSVTTDNDNENYTVEVDGELKLGDNFFSGTTVTVTVTPKENKPIAKVGTISYGSQTETLLGSYDITTGKTSFSFVIKGNATFEVTEYHSKGNILGTATVNGSKPNEYGSLIYNSANAVYGVGKQNTQETIRYFANTYTDGNFSSNFNVSVEEREAGNPGYYIGAVISKGNGSSIRLWTTFDNPNCLVVTLRAPNCTPKDVIVSNFAYTNATGGSINFKFSLIDGVLSVYNASGTLGFTVSEENGFVTENGFTATTGGDLEEFKSAYSVFLSSGSETILGVYSKKYSQTSANGIYWFNLSFTKVKPRVEGSSEVADIVWSENPWGI